MQAITLGEAQGLQAEILTYGAILHRLDLPVAGQRRSLVLQLPTLSHYEQDPAYVGPVVGRFGNRIAGGRFVVDGTAYQLTRNEHGNHLHGGALGVGKRLWTLLESPSGNTCRLGMTSPAGEEGYPGNLLIELLLTIRPDSLLASMTATTDAPTPVNLTYHPYFNLGGAATAHWLRIPASHFLPVGPGLIPTGEIQPVAGTPFDFRAGRIIAPPDISTHPQLAAAGGYDHCWVLDADADCHCELRSPSPDLAMRIRGSGPALQFYNGQFLARAHPDIGTGLILEPQGFPDAPNHPHFPSAILRPGQIHRADLTYQFVHLGHR